MRSILYIFIFLFYTRNCSADSFLVFGGKTGWIGQKVVKLLSERGEIVFEAESRLENRAEVQAEIQKIKPDYIINCAGVTGVPNVDWCENHRIETIRTNILGVLNLIDVAHLNSIPVTNFTSGCIYEYDEEHTSDDPGFKEGDRPNFEGFFFSMTRGLFENLVTHYPNVLNLRLRMPLTSEWYYKNLIVKLSTYKKFINILNSMTILEDLLPIAIDMTVRNLKGTYNFVNPGTISHNQILNLYKQYIDPSFTIENFSIEEQACILKAKRSNNKIDVTKLLKEYPNIPMIGDSIYELFKRMRRHLYEKSN